MPSAPVTLTVPSELQPLPAGQDGKAGPEHGAALHTPRAATPQPAGKASSQTGGKALAAKRKGSAAEKGAHAAAAAAAAALAAAGGIGGPAAAEAPAVPLAKHISAIIDAAKHEVEVVVKPYYATKVCACVTPGLLGLPHATTLQ